MTTATSPSGLSFLRRRGARISLGTAGAAGLVLLGASPAGAAAAADCTVDNTVDAGAGGTAADIQDLLDASAPVICLTGTFTLDDRLEGSSVVTLYGLPSATLDGQSSQQILTSTRAVTVENLTFQNGSAGWGGAIEASEVHAINSVFVDNYADAAGGAISAMGVWATGSLFQGNRSSFMGGAIDAGEVFIDTTSFVDNTGNYYGGAITTSDATVTDSSFYSNGYSDDAEASHGGAIYGYGDIEITRSTFAGNFASDGGGAIYGGDEVFIENSTFVENYAVWYSGAVEAAHGGQVIFSTFLDNEVGEADVESVGSVFAGAEMLLRGNIFAANDTSYAQTAGEPVDGGGNLFSTDEETEYAFEATEASTLFGISVEAFFDGATLDDNGGETETVALYAGSPAVDAVPEGEPAVTTDQRGVDRDELSDSGAYEFVAAVGPVGPDAPDAPKLAATGSESAGWIAAVAGVLLAAGAAVVGASRRRRA